MDTTRTTETQGNHDLFDRFREPGCPLCDLVASAVTRSMRATNYDSVSDPQIRREFEASLGFCTPHAHQWLAEAFILGTAQMYRDILRLATAQLRERTPGRRGGLFGRGGNDRFLLPSAPCPACAIRDETEGRLVRTLVAGLADAPFREAYLASDGLCLPHLRLALVAATREEAFATLRDRAVRTQEVLLAQLDETIRKHDYRFRHEPAGEEKGSPARAVAQVSGQPGAVK